MSRIACISGAILFALTACGKTYRFDLEATVTDERDGSPIAGATIYRNMWGERTDPKMEEVMLLTDGAGRAVESFSVTSSAFGAGKPTWLLRVFKDGYVPQIVEIKPRVAPVESHTRIVIPIKLRPAKS